MSSFSMLRAEIAGIPVLELARRFGTPTFVYDASMIRRRVDDLRRFDTVRYAVKACSNLAVLALLRRAGALVDTVSAFEIRRALAAGYQPAGDVPPIVYTADIFDHDSLELVVERGIHVNCGSPDMIHQYGDRAPGRNITLRVNPGFGHGHSRKTNTGGPQSKHGIWHEQLCDCLAAAQRHDLNVTGLHMHIGSGTDMEHLAQVCGAIEKAALEAGPEIRSISVGGGLPIAYRETDTTVDLGAYFGLCDAMRKRLEEALGHAVALEIEPGRYLVAESGFLVAEIRAVKHQADNLFYLVDAGFNNLARPVLYGSYHPISIAPADGDMTRPEVEAIVGGPLCESGDIFTQEEGGIVAKRRLPRAAVGDLLVIERTGAYGAVMGSNYNSKPLAAEILIDGGTPHLVRRRQTFEELTADESIPG
ncbi:MAG: diaminopimelate decarboxylase [Pirellulales bacterium]|nr:diaminopimelate decarboxylase [Pirellulales bacterium]